MTQLIVLALFSFCSFSFSSLSCVFFFLLYNFPLMFHSLVSVYLSLFTDIICFIGLGIWTEYDQDDNYSSVTVF